MALTDPIETTDERPSCCAYAAGRVFYGMKNSLYFSQVMEGESIGFLDKCHQKNDPTSEQLNGLLDTDGGVLQINEAINIKQVRPFNNGIAVYAQNGLWYIGGPDTGFTATSFFREKISDAGIASPHSVVDVEDEQFYWSQEGIFRVSTNEYGRVVSKNIIEDTVQTFYNDITLESKNKVNGSYNRIKKQVEWFYSSTAQTGATDYKYSHDKSLILDLRSGGIWPQDYNSTLTEGAGTLIVGGVSTNRATVDEEIVYLTIVLGTPSSTQTYKADFSFKNDILFQDFSSNYTTAYLETGYESLDKPSNTKKAPYITTHFYKTEENFVDDGSGGLKLDLQSGCQLKAKWDWNDSAANGRWSPSQQAYRFRRNYIPTSAGVFDSGETIITTKNKVLGRGKALSLRFEQEPQKDMQLLGYTNSWSIKSNM
jgi:hypothetical protein